MSVTLLGFSSAIFLFLYFIILKFLFIDIKNYFSPAFSSVSSSKYSS